MDSHLLASLRCPRTRQPLRMATADEVAAARARGFALDDALVTADGKLTYPIGDGIICLLASGAIGPAGNGQAADDAARTKGEVQAFYDRIGWQADSDGTFEDAARYEDLRSVARDYVHDCHLRVNRHLRRPGRFLLDVASGPVQYPEYLSYADGFERRICMDLSRVALLAARKKLGDSATYVMGDITNLPLADDSMDGVVSLHTIYHVPAGEQERAFRELGRVLGPGRSGVVVYSWGTRTLLPRAAMLPTLALLPFERVMRRRRGAPDDGLHFHAHSPAWFESQQWPFRHRILVWRSVSPAMTKALVHGRPGRMLLRSLEAAEERWPELFGRIGQYPLIVLDKSPAVD
jgi:ubiquinone/menaquinone biosynthesis C-methylase UbiE/uncharacterized protein YbaR (Trm112 family)